MFFLPLEGKIIPTSTKTGRYPYVPQEPESGRGLARMMPVRFVRIVFAGVSGLFCALGLALLDRKSVV